MVIRRYRDTPDGRRVRVARVGRYPGRLVLATGMPLPIRLPLFTLPVTVAGLLVWRLGEPEPA